MKDNQSYKDVKLTPESEEVNCDFCDFPADDDYYVAQ